MEPPVQAIGVKAFVSILNETLGFAFPSVTIEGEISEYKVWKTLAFFKIKEGDVAMDVMMPTGLIKTAVEDGMKIRLTGVPRFSAKGRYSFHGKELELAGEGALKRAFDLLKAQLEREGLFDAARKRQLPRYPQRIGLVTATTSAAYADFTKIIGQRWGGLQIVAADVQVQGAPAPGQIVGAIEYLNQLAEPLDVLVVIRGGGSMEDLQAFNTEPVARAIAGSRTPVLVGVGHEVDVTLADFAADVRAATPTDAAQRVVPDRQQVRQQVAHQAQGLEARLVRAIDAQRHQIRHAIGGLERFVRLPRQQVERLQQRLLTAEQRGRERWSYRVQLASRALAGYDPTAALKRGYAIVRAGNKVITDPAQAASGSGLVIQLAKGDLNVKVD